MNFPLPLPVSFCCPSPLPFLPLPLPLAGTASSSESDPLPLSLSKTESIVWLYSNLPKIYFLVTFLPFREAAKQPFFAHAHFGEVVSQPPVFLRLIPTAVAGPKPPKACTTKKNSLNPKTHRSLVTLFETLSDLWFPIFCRC